MLCIDTVCVLIHIYTYMIIICIHSIIGIYITSNQHYESYIFIYICVCVCFSFRSTQFKIFVFDRVPFGNPPPNWLEDLFRSVLLCTVGFARLVMMIGCQDPLATAWCYETRRYVLHTSILNKWVQRLEWKNDISLIFHMSDGIGIFLTCERMICSKKLGTKGDIE